VLAATAGTPGTPGTPGTAHDGGADDDATVGRELLAAWDGEVGAASPAAAVYELLVGELARRVATARVAAARTPGTTHEGPTPVDEALGATTVPLLTGTALGSRWPARLVGLLAGDPPAWMGVDRWDPVVTDALGAAVARLRRASGDDPAAWAWGRVRPLVLRHPLGGGALGWLLDRGPLPCGGDTDTVAQAGTPAADPTRSPTAVAAVRMVVDVGDWDAARWCLAGGQSGDPCSPHYDDQLAMWQRGAGAPIPWSASAVAAATVADLRLVPPEGAR
jgi:penicillin amidase